MESNLNDIKEQLERLKSLPEEIRNELSNVREDFKNQLIITNISKSYKKRNVVNDVSLELNRGEVIGLLGPNGAGKTTCFYIIAGLLKSDSGQIHLNNKNITGYPVFQRARQGIGYLPQEPSIFKGMSVEDNLMAIIETIEEDNFKRFQLLEDLLVEFNISKIRSSLGITLSGGERRRVEIARCLASNPTHILLDEPFSGIDPIAVKDLKNLINYLKNKNIGILITDHNVRDTLEIVERAYILYDGKVLMQGKPNELISNQKVRNVYLGESF